MTHVGQELALGQVGGLGLSTRLLEILGLPRQRPGLLLERAASLLELLRIALQFLCLVADLGFDQLVGPLESRLLQGDVAHLADALANRNRQKSIFE